MQPGDEWELVDIVVETEKPDGGGRILMMFNGGGIEMVDKTSSVMSRPPDDHGVTVDGLDGSTVD